MLVVSKIIGFITICLVPNSRYARMSVCLSIMTRADSFSESGMENQGTGSFRKEALRRATPHVKT